MIVKLTENKLRRLIKESINKHLNEDVSNNEYDDIENDSDEYYDFVGDFYYGIAIVEKDGKYNYMFRNGDLISTQWFDYAYDFDDNDYGKVYINNKCNLIDRCGRFVSKTWVDDIRFYARINAYPVAWEGNKCNIIDYGDFLSNKWFDEVSGYFSRGYTGVSENGKWNFLDEEGNILSNQWFDGVYAFDEDFDNDKKYGGVLLNGKYNWIDEQGKLVSKQWFDDIYYGSGLTKAIVKIGNTWYDYNLTGDRKIMGVSEYQTGHRKVKKATKLPKA